MKVAIYLRKSRDEKDESTKRIAGMVRRQEGRRGSLLPRLSGGTSHDLRQ